jgi:hypothetical protein
MKLNSARQRFVAALALYLIWVGALVALAVTSSERPPAKLIPSDGSHAPAPRSPAE